MSTFLDKKYINIISSKFPLFEWERNTVANFRCIYCGDSKQNKYKKRGYFFEHKDTMFYKCQNCGISKSFSTVLKELDTNVYRDYLFEKFRDGKKYQAPAKQELDNIDLTKELQYVVKISDLPTNHKARLFLTNRKIPEKHFKNLFYTDNFKKWVFDHIDKEKFEKIPDTDPRIIIPFCSKNGKPFAFQGRALNPKDPVRYQTVKNNKNPLIHGLERIDVEKEIRLLEGPFDSMFVENGLAVAGSSLQKMVDSDLDIVFIFDNEPRSDTIIPLMEKIIKQGKKIVIWPENITSKDVNDMVLSGIDVNKIIKKRTFSGLNAQLEFIKWKKI